MREIKFRHYFPTTNVVTAGHDVMTLILTSTGKEDFWKDSVWMQYTSLKDKNGKEIYEGDICKRYHITGKVLYHEERAMFILSDGFNEPLFSEGYALEVIGNIYENPELLTNDKTRVNS